MTEMKYELCFSTGYGLMRITKESYDKISCMNLAHTGLISVFSPSGKEYLVNPAHIMYVCKGECD